ncbi:MAG: hypothetical protein PHF86_03925 [Candidatus Nanoarchaeia archaeon]|nr:hypothetical protein [Candidatus Nanoarchaeia archaeon]
MSTNYPNNEYDKYRDALGIKIIENEVPKFPEKITYLGRIIEKTKIGRLFPAEIAYLRMIAQN